MPAGTFRQGTALLQTICTQLQDWDVLYAFANGNSWQCYVEYMLCQVYNRTFGSTRGLPQGIQGLLNLSERVNCQKVQNPNKT